MSSPRSVTLRLPLALALLAGGLVPAGLAQPVAEYDLSRALAEAVAGSHSLRAARSQQDAADARSAETEAVRWPALAARLSYDYASEVNHIALPLGAAGARTIEFGDGHTALASLGVEVPLYAGGALSARVGAAAAEARAARYDVASDSLAVVREARVAFFRALGAEAAARSARVAVQRLDRHRRELESRLRLGAASREAVVETLARLRVAEQQELAAEEMRDTAMLELGRVVGRPGEPVTPSGDLDESLLSGPTVGEDAYEDRPELAAVESRRLRADLEARAARGSYFPSVRAGARLNYGRPGVEIVRNDWMSWESASVSLTWPLWDRGARARRVEEATAASRALDAEHDSVHRLLESALETARRRVASAGGQAAKAAERVELERERLDLVSGRYEKGMARETELLDAHDDLADAEASAAATRAELRLAEAELLYAASR